MSIADLPEQTHRRCINKAHSQGYACTSLGGQCHETRSTDGEMDPSGLGVAQAWAKIGWVSRAAIVLSSYVTQLPTQFQRVSAEYWFWFPTIFEPGGLC